MSAAIATPTIREMTPANERQIKAAARKQLERTITNLDNMRRVMADSPASLLGEGMLAKAQADYSDALEWWEATR